MKVKEVPKKCSKNKTKLYRYLSANTNTNTNQVCLRVSRLRRERERETIRLSLSPNYKIVLITQTIVVNVKEIRNEWQMCCLETVGALGF